MKGGGKIYPNEGVKIDPRAITSAKMPESLKIYSGDLFNGYIYIKNYGFLTQQYIERNHKKIKTLPPYCLTKDALRSSHWFPSDTHLIEFFRTSEYNYKIYALRIVFFEELQTLFRH